MRDKDEIWCEIQKSCQLIANRSLISEKFKMIALKQLSRNFQGMTIEFYIIY